ncbi:MAG: acyl-CoA dehydratase activase [candidate division WOR-3 bacterium]
MIQCGIDVGSVNTKVVLYDRERQAVRCRRVEPTGLKPRETAERVFQTCLAEVGLSAGELGAVVATGYARHAAGFATADVTEIRAAAAGIRSWHPGCRTVIDIGGQDSKVIALSDSGKVREFVMNDRCAAGTGNFLAVLARALGVPLEKFGEMDSVSRRPVPVSSLCVVMAESEILSLVAADTPVEDIIAGLHDALARRVANLAARLEVRPEIVFTGGVAQNPGMKRALEQALGEPVAVAQEPLLAAALGAALADVG